MDNEFKRMHMNSRQQKSENSIKLFQSVWKKSKQRPTARDYDAPEDEPDMFPDPGKDNELCNYGKNDITLHYRVCFVPHRTYKVRKLPNGEEVEVKRPRHVYWKWLIMMSKDFQCNVVWKNIYTPWGNFQRYNQKIDTIYFPNDQDPRLIVNMTCEFRLHPEAWFPGYMVDPYDGEIMTIKDFKAAHNNLEITTYSYFRTGEIKGLKDVKWSNVRDIWRWCYIMENVLDYNDKIWYNDLGQAYEWDGFEDFFWHCTKCQFEMYISQCKLHCTKTSMWTKNKGTDQVWLLSRYINYVNACPLKDFPKKPEIFDQFYIQLNHLEPRSVHDDNAMAFETRREKIERRERLRKSGRLRE